MLNKKIFSLDSVIFYLLAILSGIFLISQLIFIFFIGFTFFKLFIPFYLAGFILGWFFTKSFNSQLLKRFFYIMAFTLLAILIYSRIELVADNYFHNSNFNWWIMRYSFSNSLELWIFSIFIFGFSFGGFLKKYFLAKKQS